MGCPRMFMSCARRAGSIFIFSSIAGGQGEGPTREAGREPLRRRRYAGTGWWESYRRLGGVEGEETRPPGTFAALIAEYKKSPEWQELAAEDARGMGRGISRVSKKKWGGLRVASVEPRHVLALRDKFADTPAAANQLLGALSSMMSWSVPRGWIRFNPCLGVKKLKGGTPYSPWSWEAICLLHECGTNGSLAGGCAGALFGAAAG